MRDVDYDNPRIAIITIALFGYVCGNKAGVIAALVWGVVFIWCAMVRLWILFRQSFK